MFYKNMIYECVKDNLLVLCTRRLYLDKTSTAHRIFLQYKHGYFIFWTFHWVRDDVNI